LLSCPDNPALTRIDYFPGVPVIPGREITYQVSALTDSYVITQDIPTAPAAPIDTLAGGLSWTGVMRAIEEAPQSHAKGRTDRRGTPAWALVCLWLGLALIGLTLVLWSLILPALRVWD
jgi:hypothetical protein